jgi:hypothetical protein
LACLEALFPWQIVLPNQGPSCQRIAEQHLVASQAGHVHRQVVSRRVPPAITEGEHRHVEIFTNARAQGLHGRIATPTILLEQVGVDEKLPSRHHQISSIEVEWGHFVREIRSESLGKYRDGVPIVVPFLPTITRFGGHDQPDLSGCRSGRDQGAILRP